MHQVTVIKNSNICEASWNCGERTRLGEETPRVSPITYLVSNLK